MERLLDDVNDGATSRYAVGFIMLQQLHDLAVRCRLRAESGDNVCVLLGGRSSG